VGSACPGILGDNACRRPHDDLLATARRGNLAQVQTLLAQGATVDAHHAIT
jgi:hypothetical protein